MKKGRLKKISISKLGDRGDWRVLPKVYVNVSTIYTLNKITVKKVLNFINKTNSSGTKLYNTNGVRL